MSASDLAAWWGAGMASLVFVWDIYKWSKAGANLEVFVSPNIVTFGDFPDSGKTGPFVMVEVRNNGEKRTTITSLVGFYYSDRLRRLLGRRPAQQFLAPKPLFGELPHVIEVGECWQGLLKQTKNLVDMSQEGHLCFGVYHSGSKRAVMSSVVIHENKTA